MIGTIMIDDTRMANRTIRKTVLESKIFVVYVFWCDLYIFIGMHAIQSIYILCHDLAKGYIPRSSLVRRNRSVPLNSDDFLATGFRSRFRRTSSDQFPWVPPISNKFLLEILRNQSELFRRKLDQNPVVRKLSELNGADRKQTGSIGSVAGKQRKQSVPRVGTVNLGDSSLVSDSSEAFQYYFYLVFKRHDKQTNRV